MRHTLDLQDGSTVYGWDHVLGFFGERLDARGRVVDSYDAISPDYDHIHPLRGLLDFLGRVSELFDQNDIDECALLLVHTLPEELPDHLRAAGEVITNIRIAADVG